MSTQATQSNNALGKRTLPSSFFAPLQTLGRYIDRQKGDVPDPSGDPTEDQFGDVHMAGGVVTDGPSDKLAFVDDDGPDGDAFSWHRWSAASASGPDTVDPEAVRGAISRLAQGAQWQQTQVETEEASHVATGTSEDPAGFAEVARRVWSEAAPKSAAPDRGMPQQVMPRPPAPQQQADTAVPSATSPAVPSSSMQVPDRGPRLAGQPATLPAIPPEMSVATISDTRPGNIEAHALAHDAGNLLSALRLYSELLCFSGVLNERHRHYAEDLKLLSLRSQTLIDRLLQLAEQVAATECGDAAAASAVARPVELPLNQAVMTAVRRPGPELLETVEVTDADTTSLADVLMRTRGLLGTIAHGALVVDLGPLAGLPVAVPSEALERVLVNLVSNAARAVRDGGAVRIRAGLVGGPGPAADPSIHETVVLTVDDSGCGMSETQLRSALGQPAHGGSPVDAAAPESALAAGERRLGLGLSIVRGLVAENGGRLSIQSRPGTGTRIEIEWQVAAAIRETKQPAFTRRASLSPVPLRRTAMPSFGGPTQAALQQPEYAPTAQGAVA